MVTETIRSDVPVIFDGIPRGVDGQKNETVPNAQWMPRKDMLDFIEKDERKFLYTPNKVFFGKYEDYYVGIGTDKHLFTVSGSRSGKGRSGIIPNLVNYRGSVLVIDPKGENANLTAKRRAQLGQNTYVVDPFDKCDDHIEPLRKGFNPLGFLDINSKDVVDNVSLIADALIMRSSSSNDDHWDDSAQSLIEGLILHVISDDEFEENQNLVQVYKLLQDDIEKLEEPMYANNEVAEGAIEAAAIEFFSKPEKERATVLSTARRHLKFMRSPSMQESLEKDDFNLDELQKANTSIYLCLPATRLGSCSRWLRLFVNLALEAVERVKHRDGEPPILMILDEMPILGFMKSIQDSAGLAAGFGLQLHFIFQDLGQAKSIYKDRWETFIANSGVIQCFGNSDLTTTEFISKKLGKTSLIVKAKSSTTQSQEQDFGTGDSYRTEVHELITPDEISRLFDRETGRQILFVDGHHPIILERVNYDEDENIKKYVWQDAA